MIDYAQYILSKQQRRTTALLRNILIALCILILLLSAISSANDIIDRYADFAAANEAMVQCLNGRLVSIGDSLVGCQLHQINLVAEVQP